MAIVDNNYDDLRRKMLEYRARNNISQAELAKRCNLSTVTVTTIERGIQNPSPFTQMKILLVIDDK